MSYNAKIHAHDFGKCVLYAAYVYRLAVPIGLTRTALSVYFHAKHYYYKGKIEANIGKMPATLTRVYEWSTTDKWKNELVRGLIEMLFLWIGGFTLCIGGAYFAWSDYQSGKVSPLGWRELSQAIEKEYKRDNQIQGVLGENNYNPLDYQLLSLFA